ncbi:MAG TPA: hypothetical protein VFV75_12975 [Candidatus Polarisedimenticolaceae bacterium]|nr:hypothetical protein [Candidatus Polarisedimenticolaceae bacterium]
MHALRRVRALVLLCCVAAGVTAGVALLSTTEVRAARCCYVMVCQTAPPYACYEKCVTCPKFP